jgi:uncharacterized membrane protein YoaK (UPF0700 family)
MMGIIARASKDVTNFFKDFTLFLLGYTLAVFVIGQFYALWVARSSEAFWYPTYLLILVLIIKVIADAFTSGKPKAPEKKK